VIAVDDKGEYLAVGPGETKITVTSGTASIELPVKVLPPISIMPRHKVLYAGQSQRFLAWAGYESPVSVTWSIAPGGSGTIDGGGIYTAPSTIDRQQIVTITAANAADASQTASVRLWLFPPMAMLVTPITPKMGPSQSGCFKVRVANVAYTNVTWSMSPANLGRLTEEGCYTAPVSIPSPRR
jgi:hypothetical protein